MKNADSPEYTCHIQQDIEDGSHVQNVKFRDKGEDERILVGPLLLTRFSV
jgi:hypothetical protein